MTSNQAALISLFAPLVVTGLLIAFLWAFLRITQLRARRRISAGRLP